MCETMQYIQVKYLGLTLSVFSTTGPYRFNRYRFNRSIALIEEVVAVAAVFH